MPTTLFPTYAVAYSDWGAFGADTLEVLRDGGSGVWCSTLNDYYGNRIGSTINSSLLPTLMTSISVELKANVWRTAVGAGKYRWFVELGGQYSYSALISPDSDSATVRSSGALARPGGGSWTRTDLTTVKFGLEGDGTGPWDGTEGSGGEIRTKALGLSVTYTSTSAPVAEFIGAPRVIFETSPVTFTDSSINSPTSWLWDFGDSSTETSTNPVHTYGAQPAPWPNNYVTVALTATNTAGSDVETKTDYIAIWKTSDPVTADFVGAPVSGVSPLAVTFTATTTGYVDSWTWAFGDTATSTSSNPTHTYSTVGTYTVTFTAANSYQTDSEEKTSYITVLNPGPSPDFTASPLSGVRPLTVTFTASNLNSNEITTYLWSFGDTKTSSQENPIHAYTAVGVYTVTLTESNALGTASTSKTNFITVTPVTAVASFTIHNMFGYAPFEARFSDLSTGDVSTWSWDFGEVVTATSSAQNPSHVYRTAGTYTATLVVNATSTTNSATATLTNITVNSEMSYGRFLDDLGKALLEPGELTPCEMFGDFGGASHVLDVVYDRLCRFQLETGALKKEATLTRDAGDVYSLPTDLIELRRLEVEGLRVEPHDQRALDLSNASWEGTSGECTGFILEPSTEGLKVTLVPHQAAARTVKALYVYSPGRPSFQSPCEASTDVWDLFPLPFVFWWIIRYGVLADLLKQEGDMYDPARALKCEEQWAFGVELTKALFNTKEGGQA